MLQCSSKNWIAWENWLRARCLSLSKATSFHTAMIRVYFPCSSSLAKVNHHVSGWHLAWSTFQCLWVASILYEWVAIFREQNQAWGGLLIMVWRDWLTYILGITNTDNCHLRRQHFPPRIDRRNWTSFTIWEYCAFQLHFSWACFSISYSYLRTITPFN